MYIWEGSTYWCVNLARAISHGIINVYKSLDHTFLEIKSTWWCSKNGMKKILYILYIYICQTHFLGPLDTRSVYYVDRLLCGIQVLLLMMEKWWIFNTVVTMLWHNSTCIAITIMISLTGGVYKFSLKKIRKPKL